VAWAGWVVGLLVVVPMAHLLHDPSPQPAALLPVLVVAMSMAMLAVSVRAAACTPALRRSDAVARPATGGAAPTGAPRQCDPDGAGRPRPRAPGAAQRAPRRLP
jgi:hypothetical protein